MTTVVLTRTQPQNSLEPLNSQPSVQVAPQAMYSVGTRLYFKSMPHPFTPCHAEIVELKEVGWDRSCQVVVVNLVDDTRSANILLAGGMKMVAKIFDTVYDNTGLMDAGVSTGEWLKENEAKIFRHLTPLQGSVIPKFIGESICHRPTNVGLHSEMVSVLLFEVRTERRLSEYPIDAFTTRDQRETFQHALKSAFSLIHSHNVSHGDPVRENLLYEDGKVVVIDFGIASIVDTSANSAWMTDDEAMVDSVLQVFGIETDPLPVDQDAFHAAQF